MIVTPNLQSAPNAKKGACNAGKKESVNNKGRRTAWDARQACGAGASPPSASSHAQAASAGPQKIHQVGKGRAFRPTPQDPSGTLPYLPSQEAGAGPSVGSPPTACHRSAVCIQEKGYLLLVVLAAVVGPTASLPSRAVAAAS